MSIAAEGHLLDPLPPLDFPSTPLDHPPLTPVVESPNLRLIRKLECFVYSTSTLDLSSTPLPRVEYLSRCLNRKYKCFVYSTPPRRPHRPPVDPT